VGEQESVPTETYIKYISPTHSDVKNQRSLLECIVQVLKAIKISPYSMHFQAAKSILCADFSKNLETLITSLSH